MLHHVILNYESDATGNSSFTVLVCSNMIYEFLRSYIQIVGY